MVCPNEAECPSFKKSLASLELGQKKKVLIIQGLASIQVRRGVCDPLSV